MRIGGLAAAILLGLATLGQAAPLNPEVVAGDAKWVAHLDVDAMRSSIVVQKAYQHFVEKSPIGKAAVTMLDVSPALIGMDPRKDLHAVTIYGSQIGKHKGVLIVFAEADRKLLTEMVKKAHGYESSTYGSYELHSWIHEDDEDERPVTGAFYKDKVMVFSGSEAEVKVALDVMDGKKPGLTCKVLAAEAPAGTTVLARVVGIAEAETPCESKLAKEIESVGVVTGENEGQSFLHVKVVAKSAEVAKQMGRVAEGVRALGVLHAIDHPKDKQLVEGMKVNVADKTVTVDGSAPAEAVWEHMRWEHMRIQIAIKQHEKKKCERSKK